MPLTNPSGGAVKSVQRGTAVIGSTLGQVVIPISAVDVNKSVLTFTAYRPNDNQYHNTAGELTTNTLLTFYRNVSSGDVNIWWFLVEYK